MAVASHAAGGWPGVAWNRLAGRVAEAAGKLAGRVLRAAPAVPGLAGAGLVALGAGEVAGHVFGHGLAPWVASVTGGVFLLLLDRRI